MGSGKDVSEKEYAEWGKELRVVVDTGRQDIEKKITTEGDTIGAEDKGAATADAKVAAKKTSVAKEADPKAKIETTANASSGTTQKDAASKIPSETETETN